MVALLYGSGLRSAELWALRIKDIDFSSNNIIVRSGIFRRHHLHPTALGRHVRQLEYPLQIYSKNARKKGDHAAAKREMFERD
ncbi:tyrosine-type recombinase/integrase [Zhongshania sp. BJYM1]|uniref:tyrosine-type recombinase/integrase n=1 Tax=Zhongshania aquatica TaxID=2965069 RepID=UPI0022B555FE|nr:tyrosine-type recombinase/integrase [Marortus sp. BJYM1]